jgi:RNA polymerase sigma-70 factor (ECF subfamily)
MPADRGDDDAVLIQRVINDDEGALAELMRAHADRLARVAYAVLGSHDAVMDVVQDTFVVLWERRATLAIHTDVAAYLSRAVRNRALNAIKHEQRQQRLIDRVASTDTDLPHTAENSGERALEDEDLTRELWDAVQTIPASPRQVLLLNWHSRMSYAEIAELLGIKVETVRKLMYRATQRLTERFGTR